MIQLSSKNDHHSVMTSSLRIKKFKKLTNLVIFRAIPIITVVQTYLEMLSPLQLINVTPGGHKVSASRAAEAREARLLYLKLNITFRKVR